MKLKTVKLSALGPHPSNPNTHPAEQITELGNSLDQFDQVKNIVVWQGLVIAGSGFLAAAQKQGREKIQVQDVSDWPEEKALKFMVADNRLADMAVMNDDLLSDLITGFDEPLDVPGIDEDFLKELEIDFGDGSGSSKDLEEPSENIETLEPNEEIKKRIDLADKIIYQFSGGRDSTLAILKTLELVRDKDPVACYVDTGTEFPDLLYFIYNFCKEHNLPLDVLHPKKNFFEIYGEKKKFPDPVFRDCIERLINNSIDETFFSYENALIIRGGRSKQKTSRSKSNIYQKIVKSKNKVCKLLNPLFTLSNENYDKDIKKISIWDGYDRGFIRTACWCCPFQREPQWEALKENYPLLWQNLWEMARSWEFKEIKGDGCIKQFKKYWDNQ